MALVGLPGSKQALIGPDPFLSTFTSPTDFTMDAANEAIIMIGHIETSDGGSHTIDTTGSSSMFWRSGAVTFANGSTTVKVGIAAVDAAAGPPGRAVNVSNVITFDVSKTLVGGGGGITANAAQNHVPDTGSKTINNGDQVAFCIQMTAWGGADVVNVTTCPLATTKNSPIVTQYASASYSLAGSTPNAFITFSDGATGWIFAAEVFSALASRVWNSGGATKEYGQLWSLPFPAKIYGLYTWGIISNNLDLVLYSDPLGTPVAEKTVSVDVNTIGTNVSLRTIKVIFPSPYTTTAGQQIAAVLKPGASNITAYYKTLAAAGQRVCDPWGTSGYGISRASGAFANANSSLDHYYIGLIAGAFDAGGGAGRAVQINNDSLVA